MYLKSLPVVPFSLAHLTGNVDVRKKVHLYLDYSVALAGFTASAFYVEAESAAAVAVCLGIGSLCEKLTYIPEYSGIGSRVGTRSPAYRRLIYTYHLVKILKSVNGGELPAPDFGTVQLCSKVLVEYLVHQ